MYFQLTLSQACSKLESKKRKEREKDMPTPSMEDHIEQIYLLIANKGYARVSDIAEALSVLPSSVTKWFKN